MNRQRLSLLAASLALATTAFAQNAPSTPPAGPGPGMGPGAMSQPGAGPRGPMDPARMQQRIDRHLADLKKDLQITAEQEGAWNQFATAMKPPAPPARADREAMAKLTTPERIDRMRELRQQHMARADQRDAAVKTFYAALSPEQKKRFDEHAARRFGPAGRGAGMPGGMHHHGTGMHKG